MAGTRWQLEFRPVGQDLLLPQPHHPEPGARVVLTPLGKGQGTRRSRTWAHISDAATDKPLGLVLKASLMRVSQAQGANPQPEATDRLDAVMTDRRTDRTA